MKIGAGIAVIFLLSGSAAMAQSDIAPSAPAAPSIPQANFDRHVESLQDAERELRNEGVISSLRSERNRNRQRYISRELNRLATYFLRQENNYDVAAQLFTLALDTAYRSDDLVDMSIIHSNFAILYRDQGAMPQACAHISQAAKLAREADDRGGVSIRVRKSASRYQEKVGETLQCR